MKINARTKALVALLLVTGAVPAAAQQPADQTQRSADRVPVIPPPPAGMGQIVFYRTSLVGAAVNCTVREGDQVLSRLNVGRYFVHVTTPGPHEYRVRSEARDVLNAEVEEGETQYVRCSIGAGFMVGRPNLSPTTQEDFQRRGGGLDPMPPREEQVRARR